MAVIGTVDIIKYDFLSTALKHLRNETYLIKLVVTDGLKLFFDTTILDQ